MSVLCAAISKNTLHITDIFITSHAYLLRHTTICPLHPWNFIPTSLHITSPLPESTYLYIYIPTYLPSTCPILDPKFYIFNDCICLHAYQYWSANLLTNLFCIAQVCQYWKSYSLIHIYLYISAWYKYISNDLLVSTAEEAKAKDSN